eukprot:scaffold354081_cov39-Attheya_sp.AAC.1
METIQSSILDMPVSGLFFFFGQYPLWPTATVPYQPGTIIVVPGIGTGTGTSSFPSIFNPKLQPCFNQACFNQAIAWGGHAVGVYVRGH